MKLRSQLSFFVSSIVFIVFIYSNLPAQNTSYGEYSLKDTTVKAVWREDVYDAALKGSVNVIKLNDGYFAGISDPEKAVIGYLATTIGNECSQDGKQNVKCKILSALNLDYQCSESNKSFLKSWFESDAEVIKEIDNCKPTIASGNVEKTFDVVKITTGGDLIKVSLKGLKLNLKENTSSSWSESIIFRLTDNKLTLVERNKKD